MREELLRAENLAADCDVRAREDQGFPRPDGWEPSATLRLQALKIPPRELTAPGERIAYRWHLIPCHDPVDAATARVYRGVLSRCNQFVASVVLKLQRPDTASHVSREIIDFRFDREQRVVRDVAPQPPQRPGFRPAVPATWTSLGNRSNSQFALRVAQPEHDDNHSLLLCLAANHALCFGPSCGDAGGDVRYRYDSAFLCQGDGFRHLLATNSATACAGCANKQAPSLSTCSTWWVAGVVGDSDDPLIPFGLHALILSDKGKTLLHRIKHEQYDDPVSIATKARGLAETLQHVHRVGWLHLDLNLNNLCIDEHDTALYLIDFGHAEELSQAGAKRAIFERIPARRHGFALPEQDAPFVEQLVVESPSNSRPRVAIRCEPGRPSRELPVAGDMLALSEHAVYTIEATEPANQLLYLDIPELDQAPPWRPQSACIYRTPGPVNDLFGFGLVILCWLLKEPNPTGLRDELVRIGDELERADGLNDCSWFSVFLTECPLLRRRLQAEWRARQWQSGNDSAERRKQEILFLELMRIAVKSIVRNPSWGFAGPKGAANRDPDLLALVVRELSDLIKSVEDSDRLRDLKACYPEHIITSDSRTQRHRSLLAPLLILVSVTFAVTVFVLIDHYVNREIALRDRTVELLTQEIKRIKTERSKERVSKTPLCRCR